MSQITTKPGKHMHNSIKITGGLRKPIGIALSASLAFAFAGAADTAGASPASARSAAVTPQAEVTPPGAPTAVNATPGDGSATVLWNAPADDGGSAVTDYSVTASPDGVGASTTGATTAIVRGLRNGEAYTFTVTATNAAGISLRSGPSNAVTPQPVPDPTIAPVTRLSDFNSDGRTDLVARDAAGRLWRYPGHRTGRFGPKIQMGTGWNVMTALVTPGDVTGDGNADLLARDSAGRLWLYASTNGGGIGTWRTRRQIGTGFQNYTITNAANMNGTGRPDLLARDSAGGLWLYPLSGNAVFGQRTKVGTGWNGYTIQGPGDVSGDRRADILARDSAGTLWLYRGNGAGRVGARTRVSAGWRAMTALVTPGNWNRALGNDLLTRDSAGRLWLYPGNNAGGLSARLLIGTGFQGMTYLG